MADFKDDLEKCVAVLKMGGLILYPTDTIWGIGCDSTNPKAIEKIYKLKERPAEKSMIVLVADENEILQYVSDPDPRIFEYLHQMKKPATVIYKDAVNLPENLIGKDGSIAIRICKDEFCKQLIRIFGKPVISTSANISGLPPALTFDQISEKIKMGVDYIVKYRQNDNQPALPSAVIRWENGGPVIVRL